MTTSDEMPDLMRIGDIADFFRVTVQTAGRWWRAGELPSPVRRDQQGRLWARQDIMDLADAWLDRSHDGGLYGRYGFSQLAAVGDTSLFHAVSLAFPEC